jgi:hypothetical protein
MRRQKQQAVKPMFTVKLREVKSGKVVEETTRPSRYAAKGVKIRWENRYDNDYYDIEITP